MVKATKSEKNGINRCPNCGGSDVKLDIKSGKLKCNSCRTLFDDEIANARGGVEDLKGINIEEGATDIIPDEKVIVTLKCPACGAEVVINTDDAVSARCHWCRHVLSLNEKMPNGAVPDLVLPFKTEKEIAEGNIREFVKKRQFFAHPKFKKEFAPDNVMGVYLPYMIVDVNAHAEMKGEAEHLIRRYTSGSGNHKTTYYDAEAFSVTRDFDLLIDDLTIESSSERLQQDVRVNTNNVINAIMPFDTENAVAWNPNYLLGFASERRTTNVDDLREQLKLQVGDIARYKVKESMEYYNRGAKWDSEEITTKGAKYKAAYLPVWLYSYLQDDGKKKMLHYVAVNARTGETMGSVPINKTRLLIVSAILEIIGAIMGFWWMRFWLFADIDDDNPFWLGLAGLTPGFIFYWIKSAKYRNMNARHKHEAETPAEVKNLKKTDVSLGRRNRLRSASIAGRNDSIVKGVVAKAGERMMGEKMANFIGIGRMAGSKASQTPTGQMTEEQIAKNKKMASTIVKALIICFFVIPMVLFALAFVMIIIFGDHDFGNKSKSGDDSDSGYSRSYKRLMSKIDDAVSSGNYDKSTAVSTMAFYNYKAKNKYTEIIDPSLLTKTGIWVSTMETSEKSLSSSRFATDAATELEHIVRNELRIRHMTRETDDITDHPYVMHLYADKSGSKYDFCDLREELFGSSKISGNRYNVVLTCVEVDESFLEKQDIEL